MLSPLSHSVIILAPASVAASSFTSLLLVSAGQGSGWIIWWGSAEIICLLGLGLDFEGYSVTSSAEKVELIMRGSDPPPPQLICHCTRLAGDSTGGIKGEKQKQCSQFVLYSKRKECSQQD